MSYIASQMPKDPNKKRIEAHLLPDDYKRFEELAKKENRSLKNYLETIVLKHLHDKKRSKQ